MSSIITPTSSTTSNSKIIRATPEAIYRAFTDPQVMVRWLAPNDMTAKIHQFDLRVGGGYRMSLLYPDSEKNARGKTSAKEDQFTSRFVELSPPYRIVEATTFHSTNPAFYGEMLMEVDIEPVRDGTNVTLTFRNIPPGIRPQDNEAGTISSLEKLSRLLSYARPITDVLSRFRT